MTSRTRGRSTAFNNKNRKKSRAPSSSPTFGRNRVVHDVNTYDGILPPPTSTVLFFPESIFRFQHELDGGHQINGQ